MSGGWIQASVSRPWTARSQSRCRTGAGVGLDGRFAGAADGLTAGTPEALHRPLLLGRAIVQVRSRAAEADRAVAGTSVRNRDSAVVSSRIHESSRPVAAGGCRAARPRARDRGVSRRRPHPRRPDRRAVRRAAPPRRGRGCGPTPACRDSAIRPGTVRVQLLGGALDRLLEREMLEGVQRVVVDEDADGPLRRQQVRPSMIRVSGWSAVPGSGGLARGCTTIVPLQCNLFRATPRARITCSIPPVASAQPAQPVLDDGRQSREDLLEGPVPSMRTTSCRWLYF
jgi:hypothetical protein